MFLFVLKNKSKTVSLQLRRWEQFGILNRHQDVQDRILDIICHQLAPATYTPLREWGDGELDSHRQTQWPVTGEIYTITLTFEQAEINGLLEEALQTPPMGPMIDRLFGKLEHQAKITIDYEKTLGNL